MTAATAEPVVTVIVPTHRHPETLDLAVASVLAQTVTALDVVVIGDGVADDTRDVMQLLERDPRVRFLDEPKSPSRAELARHRVLSAARAPYVCYLGDDDLMLADHVQSMLALLETADFAHPMPMFVDGCGRLQAHPTDLALPDCVAWHLHPRRNAISLSGAAHRLDAYRRLPRGWEEAPAGRWSDHFMWEQWFRTPGLRYATGDRLTVLKFDASVRSGMAPSARRAELSNVDAAKHRARFPGVAGGRSR